jgi:hypothetical protein
MKYAEQTQSCHFKTMHRFELMRNLDRKKTFPDFFVAVSGPTRLYQDKSIWTVETVERVATEHCGICQNRRLGP